MEEIGEIGEWDWHDRAHAIALIIINAIDNDPDGDIDSDILGRLPDVQLRALALGDGTVEYPKLAQEIREDDRLWDEYMKATSADPCDGLDEQPYSPQEIREIQEGLAAEQLAHDRKEARAALEEEGLSPDEIEWQLHVEFDFPEDPEEE